MFSRLLLAAALCCALTCASTEALAQTAAPPKNVAQPQLTKPTNQTSTPHKAKAKSKKAKQVVVTPPPPPPPPPTPEQMPAVAPEVIYRSGLLTINAQNSTMNDVLAAVRRVTGASIEKPPMGGGDRVVATIGPGQPKDVLESLFRGSHFDYIILGSMARPGGVERVILTARSAAISTPAAASNAQQGQPAVQNPPGADQEEPETDSEDMTVPEREQAPPEQEQQQQPQPGVPGPPAQEQQAQPPDQQNPNQQNPNQQGQQPQVKTPEQLLRELQQMQKQQQAPEQNQQPPENPQPPEQNQQQQPPPQR